MKTSGYGTHSEVRRDAQAAADHLKTDFGIERSPYGDGPFRFWRLPAKQYRQGHELRCEVVWPTSGALPGHGP